MSIIVGARNVQSSEMNVTPLIDVLLVLLIIFMVLPHQRGERTEIPQASPIPLPQPEEPIVVKLRGAGRDKLPRVTINRTDVGWDTLASKLREIYEKREEKALFLQGDPEIDFQYVAEIVDVAHGAGIDRVGLLATKE